VLVPLEGLSSNSEEKLLRRYLKGRFKGNGGGCRREVDEGSMEGTAVVVVEARVSPIEFQCTMWYSYLA
jgi:hypothetical protein